MKNLKTKIILSLTMLLTFVLTLTFSFSIKSYALDKPNYAEWLRDLYDYGDEITDEEIVKEKGFEDEAGRVFFKNPGTLAYDLFTGEGSIISVINGHMVGWFDEWESTLGSIIDLSNLEFNPNFTNIINYFQGDFANVEMTPGHTIKSSGCGPTSIAMVIDSLTNANIGVVGMAKWAVNNGYYVPGQGSKWSLIPDAAAAFGLRSQSIARNDAQSLAGALAKGTPVVMICGPGDFTKGGHFIVLTGMDEKGNVKVNDPASRSRSNKTYPLERIMSNASKSCGNNAATYWAISTPQA